MNEEKTKEELTVDFLSCLLGSELRLIAVMDNFRFLSCLLGSEQVIRYSMVSNDFLSCLLGSELSKQVGA